MAGDTFGTRLYAAMAARGALCVGLDPHAALLRSWGLSDDVAGLERFSRTVVEALAGRVAVVKPQSAFFERFGSRGVAVLESVITEARQAGALVLLDVKRGDIGSTAQAYADAYLDPSSPLAVDAVTASPFLGFGSLQPMIDTARAHGRGVFVLALTSNPAGPQVQCARAEDGRTVAQMVLDELSTLNAGARPWGSFGAVVGATVVAPTGGAGHDLANVNGPFLVPGLGAQGGTPEDLRRLFGQVSDQVIPSYSREILQKGPSIRAMRDCVEALSEQCASALGRST